MRYPTREYRRDSEYGLYKEVAQQGQAHPLSPAYVPDPMELDEHPGTDDEDKDEDPEEDPNEEHELENEDAKEDESSEDSDETEPFEKNETAATPPPPRSPQTRIPFSQTRLCRARKTVKLEPPMPESMEARIAEHAVAPIPPTSPTYDQAPLGHRASMICMRDDIPEEDMPPRRRFVLTVPPPRCDVAESSATAAARAPRGQYDFFDVVEVGQGLIRSPGHDVRTIARATDRAEDVGYVRRQESEIFYTQLHDARTDRRDIRLEINVVRGQRTAYGTELHEIRQAYLSSEAQNRALLARLKTLETHMSRMEWQRQRVEDDAVRQIMRTQVLEARARIDTVEDAGSSYIVIIKIMPVTRQGTNDAMTPESIQAIIDWTIQRNSTHTQDDASHNSGGGLRRPVQPARVCSYTDFMKCQPLNFKGTEGIVGLSQWLEKMES
ncbi:hypothetical protein Tco_1114991, partial [Tanacetum coccineum]